MTKDELHFFIESKLSNICQIVAFRNGQEVYADTWNNYVKEDCVHVMSVTKSIVSLLFGIAIDQKLIDSLDQKVIDFFPEYRIKRGEKTIDQVSIRHLLTMRAPYKCKGDPWTKVCTSNDWTLASLDFLGGRKGLTDEFNYQTVCLHILSGILAKATKMTTTEFANKNLFLPLGLAPRKVFYAETAEQHKEFTMSKTPKDKVWFSDPQNISTPGYGLCMSASEMAIIGQMCLNKGQFNDKQIVSSDWISLMTQPREVENPWFRGMKYGLLWWIIDEEKGIYSAVGNSGNVIYVNPKENTSIAVASSFKPSVTDRVDFVKNTLEPFVLSL